MLQTGIQPISDLTVPPLENGDRLSRAEFERRYAAMPATGRAELIEGMVYLAAALRVGSHGQPHSLLNAHSSSIEQPETVSDLLTQLLATVDR
jgi:hypothetical protein